MGPQTSQRRNRIWRSFRYYQLQILTLQKLYATPSTVHEDMKSKLHMRKISSNLRKKRYACDICAVNFSKKCELSKHIMSHLEKNDTRMELSDSDVVISTNDSDMCNVTRKKFNCDLCGKGLSSKLSLKNHSKIHMGEKLYTCHMCGVTFRHRFNFTRHLRVIHEGIRNHICLICGKGFRSKSELRDHENIHDGKNFFICEICGRKYLTKISFYWHLKSHLTLKSDSSPKNVYSCCKCSKTFTSKRSKNHHMLIHEGVKPLNCEICHKSFRTKANFDQHMKVHLGVKPFVCEHCPKRFGRKDHLVIHIRSHTGEKPYSCYDCQRAFSQINDLKKHMNIHNKQTKNCEPKPAVKIKKKLTSLQRVKKENNFTESVDMYKSQSSKKESMEKEDEEVKETKKRYLSQTKKVTCPICGKCIVRHLERHLQIHQRVRKWRSEKLEEDKSVTSYSCAVCQLKLDDDKDFIEHSYNHVNNSTVWNLTEEVLFDLCQICNQRFSDVKALCKHLLNHIPDGEDKESSIRDEIRTNDLLISKADNRITLSDNRKFVRTECNICGKIVSKKYTLKRHLATHSKEKSFTCHHCGKQYSQESGLQRHVLVIHEGIRKYKCPICSSVFSSNSDLRTHQGSHTDPRPFQCDECGRTFTSQKHLYHHRKYHHTANGLRELCKMCNRYFSSSSVLKRHHKVVHLGLKEFQCHICSTQLSTKQYLQEHLRIHTNERPEVCTVCGKTFQMTGNLRQHMKTHMEKTQICDICGKGFTRRCHLIVHIGSHKGVEAPQCELCGQTFLLKVDLYKHVKSDHSFHPVSVTSPQKDITSIVK